MARYILAGTATASPIRPGPGVDQSRSTAGRGRLRPRSPRPRPHRRRSHPRRRSPADPNRSRRASATGPERARAERSAGEATGLIGATPDRRPTRTVVVLLRTTPGGDIGQTADDVRAAVVGQVRRELDDERLSRRGLADHGKELVEPSRVLEVAQARRVRRADVDGEVVGNLGDGAGRGSRRMSSTSPSRLRPMLTPTTKPSGSCGRAARIRLRAAPRRRRC